MKLIQFHIDGEEYFINPDKIKHMRTKCTGFHNQIKCTLITFIDSEEIIVDESLKTTLARIGNQELNVGYDCLAEIEKLKRRIRNLEYHPAVQ
jgi:uncharacterized protein YlzI (FlbEa/FlbD family)